jgi:hypothetical protein
MTNGIKTINYSNVFLSCFSDNCCKRSNMAKTHGLIYVLSGAIDISEQDKLRLSVEANVRLSVKTTG